MPKYKSYVNNIGIEATERLIGFCYPGITVKAYRPPHAQQGDISVINLRKIIEDKIQEDHLYSSFEEFLISLKMFIPGEIKEMGIYTNIYYSTEAIHAVVEYASL